jgi:hypothetical protein
MAQPMAWGPIIFTALFLSPSVAVFVAVWISARGTKTESENERDIFDCEQSLPSQDNFDQAERLRRTIH